MKYTKYGSQIVLENHIWSYSVVTLLHTLIDTDCYLQILMQKTPAGKLSFSADPILIPSLVFRISYESFSLSVLQSLELPSTAY